MNNPKIFLKIWNSKCFWSHSFRIRTAQPVLVFNGLSVKILHPSTWPLLLWGAVSLLYSLNLNVVTSHVPAQDGSQRFPALKNSCFNAKTSNQPAPVLPSTVAMEPNLPPGLLRLSLTVWFWEDCVCNTILLSASPLKNILVTYNCSTRNELPKLIQKRQMVDSKELLLSQENNKQTKNHNISVHT